jgi:hypothetical protein
MPIPPMAEPTTTPVRSGSSASSPASAIASSVAATANSTPRSMRLASLREATNSGSKPRTSPAIRTGNGDGSKAAIVSMPLRPASIASQVEGASSPSGLTVPIPVMRTRSMR